MNSYLFDVIPVILDVLQRDNAIQDGYSCCEDNKRLDKLDNKDIMNFRLEKLPPVTVLRPWQNAKFPKLSLDRTQLIGWQTCQESGKNRRDGFLLHTFARLGKACQPWLDAILTIFMKLFKTRTNEPLLANAVRALRKLAPVVLYGLNIRPRCPAMIPPLFRMLSTARSHELSVEILRLFGPAFDVIECSDLDTLLSQSNGNMETHRRNLFSRI
jgi:hypothetical protein